MAVRSLQALAANRAAHLEDDRAIAQIPLVLQDRILARRFINSHGNYALVQALKERKIGLANQILLDETLPIQRLALMILQIDNENWPEIISIKGEIEIDLEWKKKMKKNLKIIDFESHLNDLSLNFFE